MKKLLSMLVALILLLGTFPALAEEDITISVLQWWEAALGTEGFREVLDRFEEENPGIKVESVTTPFGSMREQIIAGWVTGTMPDVIGIDGAWINEFVDMGMLNEMDSFLSTSAMDVNDISAVTKVDGTTYTLAQTTFVYPLFVNMDMFEAAGLEKLPTTWRELAECAKKLTDPSQNQYGLVIPLSLKAPNGVQNDIMSWLWASGGSMLKDGKPDLTNQDVKDTITFIKGLFDDGSVSPGSFTKVETDKVEEFASGRAAMMVSTLGNTLTIRERDPNLNFTVIPLPVKDGYEGESGITYACWGLGINSQSQHKEAAWKLIEYFMSTDVNVALADGGKGFPGIKSAIPEFVSTDEVYTKGFEIYQSGYLINEFSGLPTAEELMRLVGEQLQAMLEGNITVDEALANAQAAWEAAF